jgi:hypothetical protein
MTGFFFERASELLLFGLVPLLLAFATIWIVWYVLQKIGSDEVKGIQSFLTFILVVVPFVMLVYLGLAIVFYDALDRSSGSPAELPLHSSAMRML